MIFVLDTNVLWDTEKLGQLAAVARRRGHVLHVPALAWAERVAQRRRQIGATFDPAFMEAFLLTHTLHVAPFDKALAERCAEALAERYPRKEHWYDARRARCALRFQMAQGDAGKPCPATVDWYLAAPYASPFVFVTLDGGTEFEGTGAISLDAAIRRAGEEEPCRPSA
jgi:hypothetical protein